MPEKIWQDVDDYYAGLLITKDIALESALRDSEAAGLPAINVMPAHGKFLHLLARVRGAKNILEIGTLGGYSTIWMARALPANGRLITLEYEAKHAEIARKNIARAKLDDRVEIRLGAALDTLPVLVSEKLEPFDLIFIDADKINTAPYFEYALKLSRPGSVIVVDNVVRKGAIADAKSTDASVQGIRKFNDLLAREPRVSATALQTVGSKGYDGFVLALVL